MISDVFFARIRFLYAVVFCAGLLLGSRLLFVQIIRGETFSQEADAQYAVPIADSFSRGTIYFRNKDGSRGDQAAMLKNGFSLAINPRVLENPKETFQKIQALVPDIDEAAFFLKVGKKNDPYEKVASRLSSETATAIQALRIPGLSLLEEQWRYYPSGTLAAHVLGFVGSDGEGLSGQYGVERYYDHVLARDGKDMSVNFFAEIFANLGNSFFYDNASSREGNVVLSIEPEVNRFLGNVLDETLKKWKVVRGGGIIMNPATGEIYAMESRPTFDPNMFQDGDAYAAFANPLVENVFELGSIMKPLTIAFAIDAGAITSQSVYEDTGVIEINGAKISNYDGKARGATRIQEILNQSLNLGAVYVMRKTGKESFARYMRALGFGEETGIDLPNESPGLLNNLHSKRDIEYATASFGQGVAVTPIAMVRALSALANGGILVTPRVVSRIDYEGGTSKEVIYGDEKRVLKKETSEEVTRMLVKTVDEALSGGKVKLPHWSIAAKTGTAELPSPDGGYYDDKFLHSFFGYFPAYDPQFLVFLYSINPQGAHFASETLTLPFMDIAKFLISYYEIPPDR
ncbi:MAG: penicillin-binding protein 2 [Parcubacteria group bacterium]|nr:penicillin-binding protein 2 [Parcubacteria group bacterium]